MLRLRQFNQDTNYTGAPFALVNCDVRQRKEGRLKPIAILLVMSLLAGVAYAQTPQAKDSEKDVIAVVLGKKITVKDKDRLDGLI